MKKNFQISIIVTLTTILFILLNFGCDAKLTSPSDEDVVTNLKVEKVEEGKVKISWDYTVTTDDTLEYWIARKQGDEEDWIYVGYSPYETRYYFDNINTNDSLVYAYKVLIYNFTLDIYLPFSDIAVYMSEVTNPTNLQTMQLEQNLVKISWHDRCVGEEGYYIDKKVGNGNWQNAIATLTANSTSYIDSATVNQSFSYRVKPFYGGTFRNDVPISTITPIFPAPSNLIVNHLTEDIFRLSWDDNSDGEEGFQVERRIGYLEWNDVSPWNENLFSDLIVGENGTYVDDDLSLLYFQSADITYRVRAYNGEFYSEWSEEMNTKIRLNDIGQIQTNDTVKDISIYRNLYNFSYTAFLANNYDGVKVLDVSTPNDPSELVSYDLPDRTNGVYVKGNVLYAIFHDGGFTMQDIEDYNNPLEIGTISIPGVLNSIYVQGVTNHVQVGYAFVARGTNGLSIVDFGEGPPHIIGTITGLDAKKIFVPEDNGNYAYVAVGSSGGFRVINLSNPGTYTIDYTYQSGGSTQDIFVEGNYAYLADGYSGFNIVDITSLSTPILVGMVNLSGFIKRVEIVDELAFVLDSMFGMYVINISDKSNPFIQGSYQMDSNPTALDAVGSYIYVASENEIKVIQVFE